VAPGPAEEGPRAVPWRGRQRLRSLEAVEGDTGACVCVVAGLEAFTAVVTAGDGFRGTDYRVVPLLVVPLLVVPLLVV
jgi:hypothetical protein